MDDYKARLDSLLVLMYATAEDAVERNNSQEMCRINNQFEEIFHKHFGYAPLSGEAKRYDHARQSCLQYVNCHAQRPAIADIKKKLNNLGISIMGLEDLRAAA